MAAASFAAGRYVKRASVDFGKMCDFARFQVKPVKWPISQRLGAALLYK